MLNLNQIQAARVQGPHGRRQRAGALDLGDRACRPAGAGARILAEWGRGGHSPSRPRPSSFNASGDPRPRARPGTEGTCDRGLPNRKEPAAAPSFEVLERRRRMPHPRISERARVSAHLTASRRADDFGHARGPEDQGRCGSGTPKGGEGRLLPIDRPSNILGVIVIH